MLQTGDNMTDIKRTNRSAVLKILHEKGAMSRKRIAENICLTPAAVTNIVAEMISEGLVVELGAVSCGKAGRREVLIKPNGQGRCALGILINLRQAILSAVWLDGSVIFSEETELCELADADETVQALCARLMELAKELPREKIIGVGVAVRGITDENGRISRNNMGALSASDYPLAARVEELTGLPAVMENNVRALFSAHMFMAKNSSASSQFFLRCEYGIGAAMSVNGSVWHGSSGQCSEIGHIPVYRRGGKPCVCGKSGCLETVASPMAICEDAREVYSREKTPVLWKMLGGRADAQPDLDAVLNAARSGDAETAKIVDRAVSTLAGALKSVIYIVDPEKIVLYGRIFNSSYFLSRLIADMNEGVDAGHSVIIEKSPYNGLLEDKAAGLIAVEDFIKRGGLG